MSYVDRHGVYRAPYASAEKIARGVCRQNAQRVLAATVQEREAYHEALLTGTYHSAGTGHTYRFSRDAIEQRMAEERPAWELVSDWCGAAAQRDFDERAALRDEVARLRGQIERLADWLKESCHPVKAALVLKALNTTPAE